MGPEEIDIALDELETRLDRLRSLYEQYFLGIEKIEPGVARKDVDRRFWLLRRVQIRNTARRFRLQTLIQRYNTFQQHWARICREIENGTYTRHLIRAKNLLGAEPKTWAAKKRLGHFRRKTGTGEEQAEAENGGAQDLGAMLDGGTDLAAEAATAAESALALAEARAREAVPRTATIAAGPVASATAEPRGPAQRRSALEALDLDLDDDLGPPAPVRQAARPPAATASPPAPAVPAPTRQATQQAAKPPLPVAGKSPAPPAGLPPRPPAMSAIPRPETVASAIPKAAPAVSVASKPGSPAPRAPAPQTPAQRAPAPNPPAPARPAAPVDAGLSEARLREIHGELSAAKRQLKQADAVSLDALSKSLRESEKRIRAQHPGRTVDFTVVVKDGRPVVKPVVRK